VARAGSLRVTQLLLKPGQPAVALIARELQTPARALPLVGQALSVPPGAIGIYVSEPMLELYQASPGDFFAPLSQAFVTAEAPRFFVAGVWRDYARQFGAIAMDQADFVRLTGDRRVNDLALWLSPGANEDAVQTAIRQLANASSQGAGTDLIELASAGQIRAHSLRIFDRSFAVTYWLQAVAIGIGLFGIAASFSAQVLARRKEFGLLVHLGLSRSQILTLVACEGAAWTAIGALAGVCLGLAVSVILVHVVNPQSFHWTMDLHVPTWRLLALCAAVLAAGTLPALFSGRAAASHDAVLAGEGGW